MKAVQINDYGDNQELKIREIAKPVVAPGQVLVEIAAASINPVDLNLRAGLLQKMATVNLPITLGGDFAGRVVITGEEVYGQGIVLNGGSGTFAEMAAINTDNMAVKPKTLSFVEAAALPLVGVSALQALEDNIKLQAGQRILIHGGSGGIGSIAIQLARSMDAYVATTVSKENMELGKTLGADEVIDYKKQKFEEMLTDYDAVFDTVGGETTNKSFLVLKKGGILVSMLGLPDQELAEKYGVTAIGQGTVTDTRHLNRLTQWVDAGKIKVIIDKKFKLEEAEEAFTYLKTGHPKGKVVLQIHEF